VAETLHMLMVLNYVYNFILQISHDFTIQNGSTLCCYIFAPNYCSN